ncbi:DeoR/GlpR family DNA-binding transcription regulator [Planctomicrobium sp. SH661]|uniref:DeoR/GlpR family DNA-binding transcription regulator n=1 Tax=Planctomicrobium sp. SH661 TaxID=3448124 RepID=UPI003F5B5980
MFVHERHARILDYLQKHPTSSVTQLQETLGVSRSTLRRDLLELEEQEEIVRTHGGVVHRDSLRGEPSYDKRGRESVAAKRSIGKAAAAMVPSGSVVYLDAGTTCVEVGRQLAARDDVRIVTHSVGLLLEMGDCAAGITCVGGEYRSISQALVGGLCLQWLDHLRCDIAFLGASGLSVADGASTTEISETAVKQAIIKRSRKSVIVADQGKWKQPSAITFAPWSKVNAVVTDASLSKSEIRSITAQNTEFILATN